MKIILLILFISTFAHGYTLNNNFGAAFKSDHVKVFVDSSTSCDVNQITVNELESMIGPAVDRFWNEVPTSRLKLEAAGFSLPIFTINKGRLCSPTDDTCIAAGTAAGSLDPEKGLIPAVDEIIIGCNDNSANFGGGNVLAVTVPNKFSGKDIAGAVILINDYNSSFGNLSRSDRIGVIAHEIGHAIGLGHSEDSGALMYFRTVNLRNSLGQDDVDGVSYLYPMKFDGFGLLGGCGTISDGKNPPKDPPFWQMGITLGMLVLLVEAAKLFKRLKARSAT
jgi:hypothetical protein